MLTMSRIITNGQLLLCIKKIKYRNVTTEFERIVTNPFISEIRTLESEDLCLVEREYFLISLKEIDIPFGSLDTNTYTVF